MTDARVAQIVMPARMVKQLDRAARTLSVSRSALVRLAVGEYLKQHAAQSARAQCTTDESIIESAQ